MGFAVFWYLGAFWLDSKVVKFNTKQIWFVYYKNLVNISSSYMNKLYIMNKQIDEFLNLEMYSSSLEHLQQILQGELLGSKDLGFYVFRTLICIVGKPWSKQCI